VSGQPIRILYTVVNVGDVEATLVATTSQAVLWNGRNFESPGLDPIIRPIDPVPIRSGQRATATAPSTFTLTQAQITAIRQGGLIVCAIGELTYTDPLGIERRTGFDRRYDAVSDMFVASERQDQEYQD
jgi:hypothetical protein